MIYAQFWQPSALDKNTLIEATGDRSVIILDGRNSIHTWHRIAFQECQKRGYVRYTLMSGRSFTDSTEVRGMRDEVARAAVTAPVKGAHITIKLSTTNSWFDHAPHIEVARLLHQIANRFENDHRLDITDRNIYDAKHQWCGEIQIVGDEE